MPTDLPLQKPRRITIATFGSLGDLHPFLALGLELSRRGHSVTVATAAAYSSRVQALGLAFAPIGPPISPDDPKLIHRIMRSARGPEYLFRKLFLPHLPQNYTELLAITADADLLIASEVVFAAPILAEKTGLPWVSVLLSPISFLSVYDAPVFPPLARLPSLHSLPPFVHRILRAGLGLATRHWMAPLHAHRASLGLPRARSPIFLGKFEANLILAMFSSHFAAAQRDWPPQTTQTGFAFFNQRALLKPAGQLNPAQQAEIQPQAPTAERQETIERLRAFLDSGPRPVVFTLGSAAIHAAGDFFHVSAAAAHRLRIRAILITPQPTAAYLATANILVVPYADYRTLFPHASAVVHQGGIGTTAEVLRAGVPALIIPFNFDQPDNAARVVRLGVGIHLPLRKYNRRHSYYALHRLLRDEDLRARAEALGEQIRAEHGITNAADAVERLLENAKSPSPKTNAGHVDASENATQALPARPAHEPGVR